MSRLVAAKKGGAVAVLTVRQRTTRGHVSRKEASIARSDTRNKLVWVGTELLTERGFHAIGIEEVLKTADVAKGSFYHFFESKQAFLEAVIANCKEFYQRKYESILLNPNTFPLDRVREFGSRAIFGMEEFGFRRGCLIGNVGQELAAMDPHLAKMLDDVMTSWEEALACCLSEAVTRGDLPPETDVKRLSQFFFTGWQGAVLRCKMKRSGEPIAQYVNVFLSIATRRPVHQMPT